MTIDEAIIHADEIADAQEEVCKTLNTEKSRKCARDHRQLAEWLRELQVYQNVFDEITAEIPKLQTYVMFEGNLEKYVELDDVLSLLKKGMTKINECKGKKQAYY